MSNKNNIIFLENANFFSHKIVFGYEKIYFYSGKFSRGEKLPYDFLGMIDYFLSQCRGGSQIDWIYDQYIKEEEAHILNEAMGDERAHLLVKKTILYDLGQLFFSFELAEKFIKEYNIKETIDFIPKKFSYELYQLVLKKRGLFSDKINIPQWYVNKMKRQENIKKFLYTMAMKLYPLTISMLMNIGRQTLRRCFQYGVHIWDSWISAEPSPYRMSYLENEKGVNQSNTLYVMDSKVSAANLKKIKTSGYQVCSFKEMVRGFSVSRYFKKVYSGAKMLSRRMLSKKSNKLFVITCYLKTLRWFILWKMFFDKYDVKMFISVKEPGHIPRVLFQRMHGADNVFVYTSTTYNPSYLADMKMYVEPCYSFMIYKAIISSRLSNNFFKENNNFTEKYIDCGVLPADIISETKNDISVKRRIKEELGIPLNKIVIGFCDTTIGREEVFNNYEGYKIMNDVYRLLETNEDYCIIYRSRKARAILKDTDAWREFNRLKNHERVFYLNELKPGYRAFDVIGACDLIIGCPISSALHESVVGGVRTICYSPSEKFKKKGYLINGFPRYCAYGYEQLIEAVKYWLDECTEEDFKNFQDEYIKKYIDSYCDGEAAKRLHEAILECNKPDKQYVMVKA